VRVTLRCPVCDSGLRFDATAPPDQATCGGCGATIPLVVSDAVRADEDVDACPLCEGRDFYFRKDFDPKLGLTVMVIAALISAGFYWYGLDLIAYGVLGVVALIDLFVYGRLKNLSICYRCHTEFRGTYEVTAPVFDLATCDDLELEWSREVEKRWPRRKSVSGA